MSNKERPTTTSPDGVIYNDPRAFSESFGNLVNNPENRAKTVFWSALPETVKAVLRNGPAWFGGRYVRYELLKYKRIVLIFPLNGRVLSERITPSKL
jgi:hypothetical protein